MKLIFLFFNLIFISSYAQEVDSGTSLNSLSNATANQEVVNLEEITAPKNIEAITLPEAQSPSGPITDKYQFFKGQTTSIRNPFELRDPFKRDNQKNKNGRKIRFGGVVEGTSFTNLPSIANVPLDKIKISGVLIGKERRAMAKIDGDGNMYVLKEGMTLGVDGAEIKAILPGGVVLAEKIRNIYDQDEYLETILTISQE